MRTETVRCPYCGLAVLGPLAVHIAHSVPCYGKQLWESANGTDDAS